MKEVEKYLTELSGITGMSLEETVGFAKVLVVRYGDNLDSFLAEKGVCISVAGRNLMENVTNKVLR